MPVLHCSSRIFTVIQMNYRYSVNSYNPVKVLHNTFKVVYNVITCIIYMTGVKTYRKLILKLYSIYYFCNFFKVSSTFTSFSCHSFKCHRCFLIFCQNFIQSFNYFCNSCFCPFSYMGSRM